MNKTNPGNECLLVLQKGSVNGCLQSKNPLHPPVTTLQSYREEQRPLTQGTQNTSSEGRLQFAGSKQM